MTIILAPEERDQQKIVDVIRQLDQGIASNSTLITALTATVAAITATYGVRGLTGANNAGTPNTKLDLAYSEVVLRNSSGNIILAVSGSFTVDAGAAGPILNGRDQAGAFSASQFLHFYAIAGSGQTTGGLVSTVAPTTVTGPTLPSGYTHWAYLTSVRWDGSSHLLAVFVRGDTVSYSTIQAPLINGSATAETAITINTLVPASALGFVINVVSFGGTTDGSGALISTLKLRVVSGTDLTNSVISVVSGITTAITFAVGSLPIPNISQTLLYLHTVTTGSSPVATIAILSYRVPNGAP